MRIKQSVKKSVSCGMSHTLRISSLEYVWNLYFYKYFRFKWNAINVARPWIFDGINIEFPTWAIKLLAFKCFVSASAFGQYWQALPSYCCHGILSFFITNNDGKLWMFSPEFSHRNQIALTSQLNKLTCIFNLC